MSNKDHFPEEKYPLVVCRQCGGTYHRTNDRYDPNKFANGSMFTLLPYYQKVLRWGSFSETEDTILDKLVCPWCSARYSDWDGKVQIKGEQPLLPEPPPPDEYEGVPPMYVQGEKESKPAPKTEPWKQQVKDKKNGGKAKDLRKLFS